VPCRQSATIFSHTRYSPDAPPVRAAQPHLQAQRRRSTIMAKNLILWMLGVPISVLILLNIFGFI
jgi:hypothetical protein